MPLFGWLPKGLQRRFMERMLDNFRAERWDQRKDAAGVLAQKEIPVLRDLLERARKLDHQTEGDHNNK